MGGKGRGTPIQSGRVDQVVSVCCIELKGGGLPDRWGKFAEDHVLLMGKDEGKTHDNAVQILLGSFHV